MAIHSSIHALENPMDGGAWWAAVHRVAQSRTWLKRLSMHVQERHNSRITRYLSVTDLFSFSKMSSSFIQFGSRDSIPYLFKAE